jgi:hypothetical protein
MDDEVRAMYEKALTEGKSGRIASKLVSKNGTAAGKRFAGAVRSKKQYDELLEDQAPGSRAAHRGNLRAAIEDVNQDEDADFTPSPPASQDVNATISEDPAGGRRRRTRKQKRKSRKTRKHRR